MAWQTYDPKTGKLTIYKGDTPDSGILKVEYPNGVPNQAKTPAPNPNQAPQPTPAPNPAPTVSSAHITPPQSNSSQNFAYNQPRTNDLSVEQNKAQELANFLDTQKTGGQTLRSTITSPQNWQTYVRAYTYGGYSMQDIANDLYMRATRNVGGIVHPEIARNEWLAANPTLTKPLALESPNAGFNSHISVDDLQAGLDGSLSESNMSDYNREAIREEINAVAGNVLNQIDQSINNIYAKEQARLEQERAKYETELNSYKDKLGEMTTSDAYQKKLEIERQQYQIEDKINKLTEIRTKMANLQGSLDLGLANMGDQLAPMTLINRRQARLQTQGQAQIMTLAAIAGVYQDDITLFNNMIDQSMTALQNDRSEQIQALNTLVNLADQNIISLKADEKEIFNAQIDALQAESSRFESEANQLRELIKTYPEIAMKAGISMADTYDEALEKFSSYSSEHPELLLPYDERANAQLSSSIYSNSNDSDLIQAIKNAYSFVSVGFSSKQREAVDEQFSQMLKRNDPQELSEFLGTLAINAAPAEQKNKQFGRFEDLAALDDIEDLLYEYEAEGGDTGIFTGTMEKIANKIGKTLDPNLALIANQIRMAIIDYRKAVSGAAFTESEMLEYERVFPSIGKVENFNSANITSLKKTFNRNQEIFLRQMLGGKNYDLISGQVSLSGSNQNQGQAKIDLSDLNFKL